jgi:hypothetical protein
MPDNWRRSTIYRAYLAPATGQLTDNQLTITTVSWSGAKTLTDHGAEKTISKAAFMALRRPINVMIQPPEQESAQ